MFSRHIQKESRDWFGKDSLDSQNIIWKESFWFRLHCHYVRDQNTWSEYFTHWICYRHSLSEFQDYCIMKTFWSVFMLLHVRGDVSVILELRQSIHISLCKLSSSLPQVWFCHWITISFTDWCRQTETLTRGPNLSTMETMVQSNCFYWWIK